MFLPEGPITKTIYAMGYASTKIDKNVNRAVLY